MLLWFVVVAPVLVAEIFRSPMVDYRMVAIGAALPLVDHLVGATPLHTLLGAVVAMAVVMGVTSGRRLVRRRWLGIPIGWMFHLLLDATWADRDLFWWPAFGWSLGGSIPETGRSIVVGVGLDVIAIGVAVWAYRRYRLDDPDHRARLVGTGQLDRTVLS